MIAAAQAVEHYEITRYGTLKRWAEVLEMTEAVTLLDATLQEESATDETLTELADSAANQVAADGGSAEDEDAADSKSSSKGKKKATA